MDRTQSTFPPFAGRGRGRATRARAPGAGASAASIATSWRSTTPATTPKPDAPPLPPAASTHTQPVAQRTTTAASSTVPADMPQAPSSRPRSRAPSTRRNSSRRPSVSEPAQSPDIPPLPAVTVTTSGPASPPPSGSRSSRRSARSRSGSKAGANAPPPLSSSALLPSMPAIASAPPNVSSFSSRPSIDILVQHIRAIAIDHSNKNGDWAQDDDDTLPDLDDWNVGGEKQHDADVLSPVRETSPTELLAPPVQNMPISAPPDVQFHPIPMDLPSRAEPPPRKTRNSRGGKGKRKGHAGSGEPADGVPSGAIAESTPSAAFSNAASSNATTMDVPPKNPALLRKTSQSSVKRDPPSKASQGPRSLSAASRASPVPGGPTAVSVASTSVLRSKAEDAPVVQTSVASAVTLSLPTVDPPMTSMSVMRDDVQVGGDTTTKFPFPQEHSENTVSLNSPASPRTPRTPNIRTLNRPLGGSTPTTPIRMRRDDLPTHARTHSHDPIRPGRRLVRETFSPSHTPSSSRPRINLDALSKITRSLNTSTPPALRSTAVTGQ